MTKPSFFKSSPVRGLLISPGFEANLEQEIRIGILRFWIFVVFIGYGLLALTQIRSLPPLTVFEYSAIPLLSACISLALIRPGYVQSASIVLCVGTITGLMFSTYHAGGLMQKN